MASLRERARKQRPSLRTGERLDSVAESVVNHSVSPAAPADSILPADTLTDSEILALDSMPPAPRKSRIVREKVDIDNAVDFAAKDSLVMMGQNAAFMYGASNVKYADIDLSADEIHMDMKESLVYAVGRKDTTDEVVGSPVFKDRSGEYQSKTMTYNFKTSKGFITDVVTQQGEGYLTGGQTKKLADDSYNIINGRYEAYLPTIVTTNYDTEALIDRMTPRESHDSMTARATIDRLMEMCRGITLTGQSWRSR